MPLTLTFVVARGGLVPCSIRVLGACPRSIPPRTGTTRSTWLFTRRVLEADASGAKAEARIVGLIIRCVRLFDRCTLEAVATGVKAEAVMIEMVVPSIGLFTRHTLDAAASDVKAEAWAGTGVPRVSIFFARTSLRRSRLSFLGVVGTAQVVSKAQEDTRNNDRRAVGEEKMKLSLA